jgi:hypothetical protein
MDWVRVFHVIEWLINKFKIYQKVSLIRDTSQVLDENKALARYREIGIKVR